MSDATSPRPVYHHPPEKVETYRFRFMLKPDLLENLFFGVTALFTLVFAVVLLKQSVSGWSAAAYVIVFWAVLAYLALPRVHRVLTSLYVPDYFIARSRTSDGLLGDPINLAVTGTEAQIHQAMQDAGWVLADPVNLTTSWRIVMASVTRRSYAEAPVSPLMLFGKQQAFAYQQEVEGNPAQRHHVRFWPCPDGWLLPGGHRVDFLAAGTYDRSVGFSLFTFQVTHKIDRDIDVERDYIIDSMCYVRPEVSVTTLVDFSTGYHSRNGGGDVVTTDGDLPVVHVDAVPVTDARLTPQDDADDLLHKVGRRPFSVVAAGVLTTLSLLFSLGDILIDLISGTGELTGGAGASTEEAIGVGIIAVIVLLGWTILAILAWYTYQGRRGARWGMLALLSLVIFGELNQSFEEQRVTVDTMFSMSVDVLTLYALTSLSAREWTQRRSKEHLPDEELGEVHWQSAAVEPSGTYHTTTEPRPHQVEALPEAPYVVDHESPGPYVVEPVPTGPYVVESGYPYIEPERPSRADRPLSPPPEQSAPTTRRERRNR
ncbi:hypothetical protein KEM60_02164 [Austwickia sp. TVS 96-490-7B]|uniref:LssY C-terminal domain-containing protein n=1 Tax=Austwickia sp. TVS 96-490-7B TaxID=2830843 RepID=UPI001DC4A90A|nr:LssY C-terminal domain-containing protein [Austwickia sp. TVS 96-490-7B]MBW3085953.1 hypothetical protein [Austwickia sp. TVS 96-490-7B]